MLLGWLGVFDLRASSLALSSEPTDPTVTAAKRVFGIGDPLLVGRRASALATEVGITLEALDLGLRNFGAATPADRVTAGATVDGRPRARRGDPRRAGRRLTRSSGPHAVAADFGTRTFIRSQESLTLSNDAVRLT